MDLVHCLLLVLLHAGSVQAAPWLAQGAAEGGGNGYSASKLGAGLEPLDHPGAPLMDDELLASQPVPVLKVQSHPIGLPGGRTSPAPPQLDAALQPGWHGWGLPRSKDADERGKKSLELSEALMAILEEMQREHGRDQEAMGKEVPQKGGSSLSGPGVHRSGGVPGGGGQTNTQAVDPGAFKQYCIEGAMAVLGSLLFGMLLCGGICLWRKRKKRHSAAV